MGTMLLAGMLGGGGGGDVSVEPGPAQIIPPVARAATKQAPQMPGVQGPQTPMVNTGATAQAPQAIVPQEDDRRRQMIELLLNQGQSEQQIQNRLQQLDKQNFFDKPSIDPQFTPGTQGPQGLLSNQEPEEEEEERPKGILAV